MFIFFARYFTNNYVQASCGHSVKLDTQTAHILCNTGLVIVIAVPFDFTRTNESVLLMRVKQVFIVCTPKFNIICTFFSLMHPMLWSCILS